MGTSCRVCSGPCALGMHSGPQPPALRWQKAGDNPSPTDTACGPVSSSVRAHCHFCGSRLLSKSVGSEASLAIHLCSRPVGSYSLSCPWECEKGWLGASGALGVQWQLCLREKPGSEPSLPCGCLSDPHRGAISAELWFGERLGYKSKGLSRTRSEGLPQLGPGDETSQVLLQSDQRPPCCLREAHTRSQKGPTPSPRPCDPGPTGGWVGVQLL